MLAMRVRELAGPDGLEPAEVPEPEPGDGTVVIEVHSAGVGFVDLLLTRGAYQIKPELPFVPGIEVAGVVRGGDGPPAGTRVAATVPFGGFAELALAPSFLTFPIPAALEFDAAAAFTVNYQTAHLALVCRGRLAPDDVVLVHGASGGVGTAAIQVAKALGVRVIGVAAGERKIAVAREAGADEALDAHGDWVGAVRELTDGRGADVVVDPVGGERFEQSLRCMAPEGRLLVVGFASGTIPQLAVNRLLLRHLEVSGVNWGGMLPLDPGLAADAAVELFEMVERGQLDPVIGSIRPLIEGAEALRDLERREAVGKPVLRVRD
jgi:NADPH2:quinone reductase